MAPRAYAIMEGLKPCKNYRLVSGGGLEWLECPRLARLPWLLHAFSTRRGGVSKPPASGLNLGLINSDRRGNVKRNRSMFLEQVGAQRFSLAWLRQIHSAAGYQVLGSSDGKVEYRPSGFALPSASQDQVPAGDALMTDQPGILLSVRIADCLPVVLVDPRRRAVAAIHAGWRGALERVVEKTVGLMRRVFGSDPGGMLAALGPSIRACCYAVGQEVVDGFCGRFVNAEQFFRQPPSQDPSCRLAARYPMLFLSGHPPGHAPKAESAAHLDLAAVALHQLGRAGLLHTNIFVAPFCTACRTDLFFSHRREGAHTGRAMAVIGIRPGPLRRLRARVSRKG